MAQAQILIKGESVYKCDTCNRKVRVATSKDGIDVVQRCIITHGCKGKLYRVRDARDANSTSAFPAEVPGIQDWFQRRVVYDHSQPIKSQKWLIKHNLQNKPIVYAYTTKQTLASSTYSMTNVAAGTVWYKSSSGADVNAPTNPTVAGLYVYDGISWNTLTDVIPVGMVGTNIFEYTQLTTPSSITITDLNTIELTFSTPVSGTAQCISLSSQNTANPIKTVVASSVSDFKLTNNGEITIATTSSNPFITVAINFKSSVVTGGVNATFTNVDNQASVNSPWVNANRVYLNGKTYTIRSFDITGTPPVPGIMASGNVDPEHAPFTFDNFSSALGETLILLGNSPYSVVDRIYDKYIDVASLSKYSPEIYYSNGEIYISASKIQTTYPWLQTLLTMASTSTSSTSDDIPVNTHWISTVGGTSMDYGYSVATDSTGSAYIVGYTAATTGQVEQGEIVIKYSTTGDIENQWHIANTAGDYKRSIAVDATDNLLVAGVTTNTSGNNDILIIKYNSSGDIVWQKTISSALSDYGQGIATDSAGNVYVVGTTTSSSSSSNIILIKLSSAGNVLWQRGLSGGGADVGYSIAVDSANNVYLTGYTTSQGSGGADIFIAKYNTSGALLWQRSVGGTNNDYGYGAATDNLGNLYIVGDSSSQGIGMSDIVLIKYDSSGNSLWQRTIGGVAAESGYSVTCDGSNNVYITGQTQSQGAGWNDIILLKYNSSGTMMWQRALGDTSGVINDRGNGVCVDKYNNVFLIGQTGQSMTDIVVAKMPGDGDGLGTFENFVYQPTTLTQWPATLTQSDITLTEAATSLVVTNSTLTKKQTSLTSDFRIVT